MYGPSATFWKYLRLDKIQELMENYCISLVIFIFCVCVCVYPYTTAAVFELSMNRQRVWCVVNNLSR